MRSVSTLDMHMACKHPDCMPHLQVRNVSEELHRTLKEKAALEGSSLSAFLLTELEKIAKRPTLRELRQRLRRREPVRLNPPAAQVIRELRERE